MPAEYTSTLPSQKAVLLPHMTEAKSRRKSGEEIAIKKEYQYETKAPAAAAQERKHYTTNQPHTGQHASRENVMTDIFFHFH